MNKILIVSDPSAVCSEDTLGLLDHMRMLYASLDPCKFDVLCFDEPSREDLVQFSFHRTDRVFVLPLSGRVPTGGSVAKDAAALIREEKPETVVFPATSDLRLVSSQIAAHLKTGLTADCSSLEISDGLLLQTRPAFGGSLMAGILCPEKRPQMATVHPGTYLPDATAPDSGVMPEVIPVKASNNDPLVRTESTSVPVSTGLIHAKTVLCGGMGLDREDFEMLQALCEKTGAHLGATRAAVNNSLAPYSCQIGQTGVSLRADTYIGFGVSGAVQHLAGLHHCKTVIAVNQDPGAPFRDHCDLFLQMPAKPLIRSLLDSFD